MAAYSRPSPSSLLLLPLIFAITLLPRPISSSATDRHLLPSSNDSSSELSTSPDATEASCRQFSSDTAGNQDAEDLAATAGSNGSLCDLEIKQKEAADAAEAEREAKYALVCDSENSQLPC
ncbi:MAG: hypothetical protein MHMPM18_004090 [Marteilia pararefringens]